jgi:hypothetical protein
VSPDPKPMTPPLPNRCHAPNPRGGYAHCIRAAEHPGAHLAASGDSWPNEDDILSHSPTELGES